jgi:hypothetical protein
MDEGEAHVELVIAWIRGSLGFALSKTIKTAQKADTIG